MSDSNDIPAADLPDDDIHHYFTYDPNWGACIFFIVIFAILTLLLLIQGKRYYWLHALTLMGAMECSGYIARIVLYASPNASAFKAELVILILAPNLLAFTCYVILGKIITYVFDTHRVSSADSWLTRNPHWIPYFYVSSDILCITIQGIGGGILSGADTSSQLNTGKAVEVTGLALQLFFIATFLVICFYVWRAMQKHQRSAAAASSGINLVAQLRPAYIALAILIGLLVVRNIYRTAEFSTGGFTTGYFERNEAWYDVFDSTLMSVALMVAIAFDFTKRLPKDCLVAPVKKSPDTMEMTKGMPDSDRHVISVQVNPDSLPPAEGAGSRGREGSRVQALNRQCRNGELYKYPSPTRRAYLCLCCAPAVLFCLHGTAFVATRE